MVYFGEGETVVSMGCESETLEVSLGKGRG